VADWEGVRQHIVTGKGGTGKTTVAAALALALAAGGRKVLLVEVEGRQGLAQLFDVPPLPYEERKLAVAPDGGDVYGLAIDVHEAMYEYLEMYYRLGRAGKALDRIGAVDFVTTIAPGMRDVLLTGKTYEAVRRRGRDNAYVYDAVVMDAPPTGRITRFLNVNTEVSTLARMGPVHRQAESIMGLMHSPRTVVHLVTILEEMPVQETIDGAAELSKAGIHVGAVVVNLVRTPHLGVRQLTAARRGRLDRADVAGGLSAAGLPADDEAVDALLVEAADHADRVALERQERANLQALGRPLYELPRVSDGIDLGALYALAEALREQGAA
jgi:anion-transporting  ArsA/GET3 family ATPase